MNRQILSDETLDDGPAIQSALAEMTGQSTVPNIFIKQQHIGGNSDILAIQSKLPNILKDAGAL
jgi:glutaredoxin 3